MIDPETVRAGGRWAAVALLALALPLSAQQVDSSPSIEGTIRDAQGNPVSGCRAVVRVAGDSEVFLSQPSDEDGRFVVSVPGGRSYVVVAALWPSGRRLSLAEQEPVAVGTDAAHHDVALPLVVSPPPRQLGGSIHRQFLGFVEDPAIVDHGYAELQLETSHFESADFLTLRPLVAFSFAGVTGVEVGLRAGFAEVDFENGRNDSGATDLEGWMKLQLFRSASERLDLAVGALVTVPTGDDDLGLGEDALQSKLFLAASYGIGDAALVGHVGVRTTEDGRSQGVPLDGRISATIGAGFVVPFSPSFSFVVEAHYDGERFTDSGEESRLLFGLNWKTGRYGVFRAAVAGALVNHSPDAQILAGYARTW